MPSITTAKRLRLSNNSDSGGFGLLHREEVRVNRHIFKPVYTILQLTRSQNQPNGRCIHVFCQDRFLEFRGHATFSDDVRGSSCVEERFATVGGTLGEKNSLRLR